MLYAAARLAFAGRMLASPSTTDAEAASLFVVLAVTAIVALAMVMLRRLLWWNGCRLVAFARALTARMFGSRAYRAAGPVNDLVARRYPQLHGALHARLHTGRFTGLPLTLLAAAAFYVAALFGGLIDELREAEEMVRFDEAVMAAFDPLRVQPFLDIFLWITDLGASPAIVAVAIVATAFLCVGGRLPAAAGLWVTVLGSQATTQAGKWFLGRARPEFLTLASETSAAFPSGHATAAMAVYGFLGYILARASRDVRQRFEIAYGAGMVIAVIAFSRLYLRLHFPSDLAGGLLVGGFWLLVGVAVTEWSGHRPRRS